MSRKHSNHGSFSFAELRCKEVVNSLDGKRLGRIIDIVFDSRDGRVRGLVVPHTRRNIIFKNSEPIFIPWDYVDRVGEDIIMVRLAMGMLDGRFGERGRALELMKDGEDLAYAVPLSKGADKGKSHIHSDNTGDNNQGYSSNSSHNNNNNNSRNNNNHNNKNNSHSNNNNDGGYSQGKGGHRGGDNKNANGIFEDDSNRPNCDNQCEKCMLFDCQYRWGDNCNNGCKDNKY